MTDNVCKRVTREANQPRHDDIHIRLSILVHYFTFELLVAGAT